MININSLSNTSLTEIYKTFVEAFSDYQVKFNPSYDDFLFMMNRRGMNRDLSFGAFENQRLLGFTLNGIGLWNGLPTAYDTGTGTIPDYRKRGLAKRIFQESLPVLRQNNIKQYLLEVLKQNKVAYELYKKQGFEVIREFDYYVFSKSDINNSAFAKCPDNIRIEEIDEFDWDKAISFYDFEPSWQNNQEAVERSYDSYFKVAAYKDEKLVGFGFLQKSNGDIPQIAVNNNFRRKGIGSQIFKKLIAANQSDNFQIINIENKDAGMKQFLENFSIFPNGGQFEMILKL
ncbi:MAG: GNAT family N-acetyltransferase [Bacteroidales bacterium]|nr:GNAT family N-acetyltransferase [Bacteroidales bacterium]